MRSFERYEIGILCERGGEGGAIGGIPGVDYALMDGTNGVFVSGSESRRWRIHNLSCGITYLLTFSARSFATVEKSHEYL
jgi:hypothetical protein